MTKITKLIFLIVLLACLPSCSVFSWLTGEADPPLPLSQAESEKILEEVESRKRLMVLDFINRSDYGGASLGKHMAQKLKTFVSDHPQFVLIKADKLKGPDHFVSDKDTFNYSQIFQRIANLDVEGIILGQILSIEFNEWGDEVGFFRSRYYTVKAKVLFELFDVHTRRLLLSKVEEIEMDEEHTRVLDSREPQNVPMERAKLAIEKTFQNFTKLLPQHAKQIAWRGRIAKVTRPRIYINAGEKTGLRIGNYLNIYGKGAPIQDPKSGEILGISAGRFKGTLRIIEMMGDDASIAIVHSGGGFKPDDRVHLHMNKPPVQQFSVKNF